jgi:DUF4097 and DUF4098 domain-containing protein YvlB
MASVEAETVSADILLEGSRGENVILRTVSGDLQVEASPGRIELNSVSGDVEFQGSVTRANIQTVSGEIVLVGAGRSDRQHRVRRRLARRRRS